MDLIESTVEFIDGFRRLEICAVVESVSQKEETSLGAPMLVHRLSTFCQSTIRARVYAFLGNM